MDGTTKVREHQSCLPRDGLMPGPDFLRSFQASTVLFSFRSNLPFFYSAPRPDLPNHIRPWFLPSSSARLVHPAVFLPPAGFITDIFNFWFLNSTKTPDWHGFRSDLAPAFVLSVSSSKCSKCLSLPMPGLQGISVCWRNSPITDNLPCGEAQSLEYPPCHPIISPPPRIPLES